MNKIYEQLMIEANLLGYNISDKELKKIYKLQKSNRDKLLNELALIVLKYNIKEEKISLSSNDRKKLKQKLDEIITDGLQLEFDLEKETTKEVLYQATDEGYKLRNYILSLGTIAIITPLTKKELWKIINAVVDGEIWSDRLWSNKKVIEKDLKKTIHEFLNGRISVNKIYKEINNKYSKNAYNTKRLTETEIARVQEAANKEFNKQHGIQWVLYCATLDSKTCTKCAEDDGRVFHVDDVMPTLPRHPLDRCCYISIPNQDWRPKKRRDNTKVNTKIDWKDYNSWKQENNM